MHFFDRKLTISLLIHINTLHPMGFVTAALSHFQSIQSAITVTLQIELDYVSVLWKLALTAALT